jgi:hypothetical protein
VKPRTVAWVAWSAWALLAGLTILLQTRTAESYSFDWLPAALDLGSFVTVGAVVVSRQPHNRIGWLCCAAGLLGIITAFSGEYARYAFGPHGGPLPGGLAMAWLNAWIGTFWAALVLSLLLLLFPTGRPPSRRWRPVAWACTVCVTALCVQQAVMPGPLEASGQPNPLGIDSARAALEQIYSLLNVCFAVLILLCAGSVVVRFRRAGGVERQQLKWFVYAAGQLAVLFALAVGLPGLWSRWVSPLLSDLVFGISFALIPVAIGIAILRYRLYDIDRLIRRTLVYGLLSALLAAVYAGLVLSLEEVFGGIGGQPPSWVVAGATLAVAALFQPARRRISRPWISASTGAATTPPRRSRPSVLACATTSTWMRSRPNCWPWSTRPWSRPRPPCGSDALPSEARSQEPSWRPDKAWPWHAAMGILR